MAQRPPLPKEGDPLPIYPAVQDPLDRAGYFVYRHKTSGKVAGYQWVKAGQLAQDAIPDQLLANDYARPEDVHMKPVAGPVELPLARPLHRDVLLLDRPGRKMNDP